MKNQLTILWGSLVLYITNCFSPEIFRNLWLILNFWYFNYNVFWFGSLWVLICNFLPFLNLDVYLLPQVGTLSAIISLNNFPAHLALPLLFLGLCNANVIPLDVVSPLGHLYLLLFAVPFGCFSLPWLPGCWFILLLYLICYWILLAYVLLLYLSVLWFPLLSHIFSFMKVVNMCIHSSPESYRAQEHKYFWSPGPDNQRASLVLTVLISWL